MHPELLNNSLFLKYYSQWQKDPTSIVFAPIAEYLMHYGMLDDAARVCEHGIERHPGFISGHLVMAKIHLKRNNLTAAGESVRKVLSIVPDNKAALDLQGNIRALAETKEPAPAPAIELKTAATEQRVPSWETITMANIYSAQGHHDRARKIYESILSRDPGNEDAKRGIDLLPDAEG